MNKCPACGEGVLSEQVDATGYYLVFSVCNHCAAELVDAKQARENKKAQEAPEASCR
jgi:hypothetical protein